MIRNALRFWKNALLKLSVILMVLFVIHSVFYSEVVNRKEISNLKDVSQSTAALDPEQRSREERLVFASLRESRYIIRNIAKKFVSTHICQHTHIKQQHND